MKVPVSEAAGQLEARGVLKREAQDHSERVIEHVGRLLKRELPVDLVEIDGAGGEREITHHQVALAGHERPGCAARLVGASSPVKPVVQ